MAPNERAEETNQIGGLIAAETKYGVKKVYRAAVATIRAMTAINP